MRAAPSFHLRVDGGGAWRGVVAACAAASGAVFAAWVAQRFDAPSFMAALAAATASAASFAIAWRASRIAPLHLSFERDRWHVGRADEPFAAPWSGSIVVSVDLGDWMLLRFDCDAAAAPGCPARWLPVGRSAAPSTWHALRCAVYSPRLAAASAAPDAPADL